jgi:hypothetical protein
MNYCGTTTIIGGAWRTCRNGIYKSPYLPAGLNGKVYCGTSPI